MAAIKVQSEHWRKIVGSYTPLTSEKEGIRKWDRNRKEGFTETGPEEKEGVSGGESGTDHFVGGGKLHVRPKDTSSFSGETVKKTGHSIMMRV